MRIQNYFIIMFVIMLTSIVVVHAQTNITSCVGTLTGNDTYTLQSDIDTFGSIPCLIANDDNVTIDLNNFKIFNSVNAMSPNTINIAGNYFTLENGLLDSGIGLTFRGNLNNEIVDRVNITSISTNTASQLQCPQAVCNISNSRFTNIHFDSSVLSGGVMGFSFTSVSNNNYFDNVTAMHGGGATPLLAFNGNISGLTILNSGITDMEALTNLFVLQGVTNFYIHNVYATNSSSRIQITTATGINTVAMNGTIDSYSVDGMRTTNSTLQLVTPLLLCSNVLDRITGITIENMNVSNYPRGLNNAIIQIGNNRPSNCSNFTFINISVTNSNDYGTQGQTLFGMSNGSASRLQNSTINGLYVTNEVPKNALLNVNLAGVNSISNVAIQNTFNGLNPFYLLKFIGDNNTILTLTNVFLSSTNVNASVNATVGLFLQDLNVTMTSVNNMRGYEVDTIGQPIQSFNVFYDNASSTNDGYLPLYNDCVNNDCTVASALGYYNVTNGFNLTTFGLLGAIASNQLYFYNNNGAGGCTPVWIANYSACTNNSETKTYYDMNMCNNNSTLPIDNGTTVSCGQNNGFVIKNVDTQPINAVLISLFVIGLIAGIMFAFFTKDGEIDDKVKYWIIGIIAVILIVLIILYLSATLL